MVVLSGAQSKQRRPIRGSRAGGATVPFEENVQYCNVLTAEQRAYKRESLSFMTMSSIAICILHGLFPVTFWILRCTHSSTNNNSGNQQLHPDSQQTRETLGIARIITLCGASLPFSQIASLGSKDMPAGSTHPTWNLSSNSSLNRTSPCNELHIRQCMPGDLMTGRAAVIAESLVLDRGFSGS